MRSHEGTNPLSERSREQSSNKQVSSAVHVVEGAGETATHTCCGVDICVAGVHPFSDGWECDGDHGNGDARASSSETLENPWISMEMRVSQMPGLGRSRSIERGVFGYIGACVTGRSLSYGIEACLT